MVERIIYSDSEIKKFDNFMFFAQCRICNGVGEILIPSKLLTENLLKYVYELENDTGFEFVCPKCMYVDKDDLIETGEKITKWIDVLEKDDRICLVSKNHVIVDNGVSIPYSSILEHSHGFNKIEKK